MILVSLVFSKCDSSVVFGHPVLRLINIPLPIHNGIQPIVDVVASTRQMLAEAGCAAEGAGLLQHMSSLPNLSIRRLEQNLAVVRYDLYRKQGNMVRVRIQFENQHDYFFSKKKTPLIVI